MNIPPPFSYCPHCKEPLLIQNRLLDCTKCGFHFYINPAACNGVILINQENKLLLVKRKFEPKKGDYDLPGGFIDYDESVEESIARELQEELGITVENLTYFMSFADEYTYKGFTYHTLGMIYTVRANSTTAKAADDVESIEYFDIPAIPFDRIAFKSVKKALTIFASSSRNRRAQTE